MKIIIINFIYVLINAIKQDHFLMNGQRPDMIGEEHQIVTKDSLNFTNNNLNYFYAEDDNHVVILY
jgi:hypothetical protein